MRRGELADRPSWATLGVVGAVIAIFAALGMLVQRIDPGNLLMNPIFNACAAAIFGGAGMGWRPGKTRWVPMSYPVRSLYCVLATLLLATPLLLRLSIGPR